MVRFLDGPAQLCHMMLRRGPLYLRVTRKSVDCKFVWDALDQLQDEAQPGETLFCYYRVSHGRMHLRGRREITGWWSNANYRLLEPQPDQETMRDTTAWRAWCRAQPKDPASDQNHDPGPDAEG